MSDLYRGRLYLWTFDGSIQTYDWNELVFSLLKNDIDEIALRFCFIDGNYLYKTSLITLFQDDEFKDLLLRKFERLADYNYDLFFDDIASFLMCEQDTLIGLIPTDTEIYSNQLYFINDKGLFKSAVHRGKKQAYLVGSRPKKLWDCNLLSIKANKYPQLALSGGDEGLFELNVSNMETANLKKVESNTSISQIGDTHSSFSNYTALSIYNSSNVESSYMALFNWKTITDENLNMRFEREYQGKIDEDDIFDKTAKKYLSWGIEDKIYKATEEGFEISKFNNHAKVRDGESLFTQIRKMNLHAWKGDVISGGTAYFGTIVECENALVVMLTDGTNYTIPGSITRWRVYPRSLNYENHLHVIHDDRIEIYSFNQDYFLTQSGKELGIEYKPAKHQSSASFNTFG